MTDSGVTDTAISAPGSPAFAPGDNPWYRPGRHTGDEHCPVRPLHDPCHTGCSQDSRGSDAEILRDLLATWRAAIAGRAGRDGPDLLDASGRGDSLPEMRASAMAKARKLYGPDAELRVDHASPVRTYGTGFTCCFTIRCLNFPGEAL
jgi:hypothetical protein